jgi:c-di-GMP-related signal transduction protein
LDGTNVEPYLLRGYTIEIMSKERIVLELLETLTLTPELLQRGGTACQEVALAVCNN